MLTSQNVNVAQTTMDITYFSFMNYLKYKCALYVHQRHICACPEHLNMCISFPSEAPKYTFTKRVSDPYRTLKYGICNFLGMHKCASSKRIKQFSELCNKLKNTCFFISYVLIRTGCPFSTLLHTCGLYFVSRG